MTWIVNGLGVLLILFVIGWFWMSKPRSRQAQASDVIEIVVEGGVYEPARIEIPPGQPTTLRFTRRDASPCAEKVVFSGLGISAELPLNEPQNLDVVPLQPGEYEFTCQMGMYRGILVVK